MRRFQVGLGEGSPCIRSPFPSGVGGEGCGPTTLGKVPRQISAQPCAGGGAAPSQLMLAAKGGFIRVPLKEMLIVTFLHD